MAITTNVISVGTAGATLISPTIDAQDAWIENLEPSNEIGSFSRDGYAYAAKSYFPIANNGTAIFSFTTGTTGAQIDNWDFDSSSSSVLGELIEGATITTSGTAIAGYNLNRNESDAHDASLVTASALTDGTVVYSTFIGASNQSTGGAYSNVIITLKPSTQYGFRFIDIGGTGTNLHAVVGWVEKYNGLNDVYLNGAVGQSVRLRGGEKIQLALQQGEGLTATASREGVQVAVMRQD